MLEAAHELACARQLLLRAARLGIELLQLQDQRSRFVAGRQGRRDEDVERGFEPRACIQLAQRSSVDRSGLGGAECGAFVLDGPALQCA